MSSGNPRNANIPVPSSSSYVPFCQPGTSNPRPLVAPAPVINIPQTKPQAESPREPQIRLPNPGLGGLVCEIPPQILLPNPGRGGLVCEIPPPANNPIPHWMLKNADFECGPRDLPRCFPGPYFPPPFGGGRNGTDRTNGGCIGW